MNAMTYGSEVPGLRKAAVLMMSVGDELSTSLFQGLSEDHIQRVVDEISRVGEVTLTEQAEVLTEFHDLLETQQVLLRGGPDQAERLLTDAFGKERAEDLMAQIYRLRENSHGDLAALQQMDPTQLSKFLEGEHPQTIALVLAHLHPKQGSAVLMQLREDLRVEAVRRLAEMRQFSPEMAQKVALILYRRIEALGANGRRSYAGFKAVADLLNRLDQSASRNILDEIEQKEPKLALGIRNLMFTFDDLITVPSTSIRELVNAVDKKVLAISLKTADENLRTHVFQCMSSRAVDMLKDDIEALGPIRGRDISQAQQEMLALARRLDAEGKIILKMEADSDITL
ncbi:flagellar motor switch protein FliG [Terriglobus saanensis]|uniref:Flagellar motor switch protein FliG n=1 Tax=Terriglobus saanensis (strain ATCC BAA-1853 / DSM 23119 / SP1PR4) TaxID=401053 RepID=E8V4Z1_TERSS|nr:flagellar motor switch protein FliG [Terriglobus saanensis]ADV82619.1 flagellar motor switch protein FliG [Terriglobus saanensis SP1PR4]